MIVGKCSPYLNHHIFKTENLATNTHPILEPYISETNCTEDRRDPQESGICMGVTRKYMSRKAVLSPLRTASHQLRPASTHLCMSLLYSPSSGPSPHRLQKTHVWCGSPSTTRIQPYSIAVSPVSRLLKEVALYLQQRRIRHWTRRHTMESGISSLRDCERLSSKAKLLLPGGSCVCSPVAKGW